MSSTLGTRISGFVCALLAGALSVSPARGEVITIDTTQGTINGLPGGGTFHGTSFTTSLLPAGPGSILRFTFHGDLIFNNGDDVAIVGGYALSLLALNNVTIGDGVVFDASSQGSPGGPGGGDGGAGGSLGTGGYGARKAFGAVVGYGGGGGSGGSGGSAWPGKGGGGHPGHFGTWGHAGEDGWIAQSGSAGAGGLNNGAGGASAGGTTASAWGGTGGQRGAPGNYVDPPAGGTGGGNGQNGYVGGDASYGRSGAPGSANAGAAGKNAITGSIISGGGGGGGGSGGGGGGGGGAGGGGSGGWGGGGGAGGFLKGGGGGGNGGNGGNGGEGGDGGDGGNGGWGGGGGGAVEILANGRMQLGSLAQLYAIGGHGATGSAATKAPGGGQSRQGGTGGAGGSKPGGAGDGGTGGWGGDGGNGGGGGAGASGGAGGGGSGGTIKLDASVIQFAETYINTSGGNSPDQRGGDGRLLLGANAAAGFPDVTGAHVEVLTPTRHANRYLKGAGSTPNVPDLKNGCATFGLLEGLDATAAQLAHIRCQAEEASQGNYPVVAALVRCDVGPDPYDWDFAGFDMLLFVNLTGAALDAPVLGVDPGGQDAGFLRALAARNGMLGPLEDLPALGPDAVWATLIPEDGTTFNATLNGAGIVGISGTQLHVGEAAFIHLVPEPATLFLLGIGGLAMLRRKRS